jgi:hypothetical protein
MRAKSFLLFSIPTGFSAGARACATRVAVLLFCLNTLGLWAGGAQSFAAAAEKSPPSPRALTYQTLQWDALVPADWKPAREFSAQKFELMVDADPRAEKALRELRKAWDKAPVVAALNGKHIIIRGFVVPLDHRRGEITEFLLVPYFGACIHTPPPPANQIIHVFPETPMKQELSKGSLFVSGLLETVRSETGMGIAGYRMKAASIIPSHKQR